MGSRISIKSLNMQMMKLNNNMRNAATLKSDLWWRASAVNDIYLMRVHFNFQRNKKKMEIINSRGRMLPIWWLYRSFSWYLLFFLRILESRRRRRRRKKKFSSLKRLNLSLAVPKVPTFYFFPSFTSLKSMHATFILFPSYCSKVQQSFHTIFSQK